MKPGSPLPCQRELFDIPPDVAYLNCAYMAPRPRAATEAGLAAVARQAHPWKIAAEDFFSDAERARSLAASVIGAPPDSMALIPAVSYGIAVAARNVTVTAGDTIVVLAEQFPSNVYTWHELARDTGAAVVTVARPTEDDWTSGVLDHVDDRTAVVAVPNCHWTDGTLVDLVAVGEACRDHGAALVVDASQSAGAMPIDLAAVQPDFLVTVGYKWLFGPYSTAFLYVDPRHYDGSPIEHNWIARRRSEDFAGLVDYEPEFQPGARRYDVGERSNFSLLPMTIAALEMVEGWTVDAVATTLRATTDAIAERATAAGYVTSDRDRRAPHLLGLRHPGCLDSSLAHRLAASNVFVSVRGDSIRVAPHLYNTPDDVDRLFAEL